MQSQAFVIYLVNRTRKASTSCCVLQICNLLYMNGYRQFKIEYKTGGAPEYFEEYLRRRNMDRFTIFVCRHIFEMSDRGTLTFRPNRSHEFEVYRHQLRLHASLKNFFNHWAYTLQHLKQMCVSDVKVVISDRPHVNVSLEDLHTLIPNQAPLSLESTLADVLNAVARYSDEGGTMNVVRPLPDREIPICLIVEIKSFRFLMNRFLNDVTSRLLRLDLLQRKIVSVRIGSAVTPVEFIKGLSHFVDENDFAEIDLTPRIRDPSSVEHVLRMLRGEPFEEPSFDFIRTVGRDLADVARFLQMPIFTDFFDRFRRSCPNKLGLDFRA